MQFQLLITAKELFTNCDNVTSKQERLIAYARWLYTELERPLQKKDFSVPGRVSRQTINGLFDSFKNFLQAAELPSVRRKLSMTNDELKNYLISIREITENNCWVTDKYKSKTSDGRVKIKFRQKGMGKSITLHRLSYLLFKEEIMKNHIIMHACDNPPCFNPDHLSQGTPSENIIDAVKKGRKKYRPAIKKPNDIGDPYNYSKLMEFIEEHTIRTDKEEWLYTGNVSPTGYPVLSIKGKNYYLHKLIVANTTKQLYEQIEVARHILPDGSKPDKRDLNPDHLTMGTYSQNSYDARDYSKSFKLNLDQIAQVEKSLSQESFSERGSKKAFDGKWANTLNVSSDTITRIRIGKS